MIFSVRILLMALVTCSVLGLSADAQPEPGPGGGGPGDPPRTTPGLDPATLAGMAVAGYMGVRIFRHRRGR
jgi:hypothetical protein